MTRPTDNRPPSPGRRRPGPRRPPEPRRPDDHATDPEWPPAGPDNPAWPRPRAPRWALVALIAGLLLLAGAALSGVTVHTHHHQIKEALR